MSEKQKLGQEPAFGFSAYTDPKEGQGQNLTHSKREGMSKRFYVACAAMQGLLSNSFVNTVLSQNPEVQNTEIVNKAYAIADELLNQENQ